MNSRQRVLAALEGKPADRPPVDLWYTDEVREALYTENSGAINEALSTGGSATPRSFDPPREEVILWRLLGLDKIISVSPVYAGEVRTIPKGADRVTPWGGALKTVQSGQSEYLEYAEYPLAGMEEPEELDAYPWWPDPEAYDLSPIFAWLDLYGGEFATNGPWVSIFEIYCAMRGLEEAMVDLLANPEFAVAAFDRIESIQTRLIERILTEGRRRPDMIMVSDDMASQDNLFFSLDTWKDHFRPRLRRWCALAHSHGAKVFYHSDGAVEPLIPHLIDAGIDILNPLQHQCPGMEMDTLRKKYGGRIAFHGGVDTQQVLPFGTAEDVRAESLDCLENMRGARFVCASCHKVQAGTPIPNILALIEAVRGWK